MMYGLGVLRDPQGLPLCLRLLRDIHARLLQKGRGQGKNPGEFSRSQNWIGGTRTGNAPYVPPPVNEMGKCLSDLERFKASIRLVDPICVWLPSPEHLLNRPGIRGGCLVQVRPPPWCSD